MTKEQASRRLGINQSTFDAACRWLGIRPAGSVTRDVTVEMVYPDGLRRVRRRQRYALWKASDVRRIQRARRNDDPRHR
jgi:hypothetical protein